MTVLDLSILSIAIRFEQELHKQLHHSKWARNRRYRHNKRAADRAAIRRTADALRAEVG